SPAASPSRSTLFPYTTLFRSVGIVYAKGRVTPLGAPIFSRDPVHLRPPVAQTFAWGTRRLTVAVAHFKSRRCSGASGADLEGERSEEHTSELQSRENLVCRLL